jgi:hypothetical protein
MAAPSSSSVPLPSSPPAASRIPVPSTPSLSRRSSIISNKDGKDGKDSTDGKDGKPIRPSVESPRKGSFRSKMGSLMRRNSAVVTAMNAFKDAGSDKDKDSIGKKDGKATPGSTGTPGSRTPAKRRSSEDAFRPLAASTSTPATPATPAVVNTPQTQAQPAAEARPRSLPPSPPRMPSIADVDLEGALPSESEEVVPEAPPVPTLQDAPPAKPRLDRSRLSVLGQGGYVMPSPIAESPIREGLATEEMQPSRLSRVLEPAFEDEREGRSQSQQSQSQEENRDGNEVKAPETERDDNVDFKGSRVEESAMNAPGIMDTAETKVGSHNGTYTNEPQEDGETALSHTPKGEVEVKDTTEMPLPEPVQVSESTPAPMAMPEPQPAVAPDASSMPEPIHVLAAPAKSVDPGPGLTNGNTYGHVTELSDGELVDIPASEHNAASTIQRAWRQSRSSDTAVYVISFCFLKTNLLMIYT